MADFTKLNGYTVKDPQAVHTYDTVADLKADAKLKAGNHVQTKGYTTTGDGGHGTYIIVDDNTLVDNGGSIHELNNGLMGVLINDGEVNIKQFGAYGDGTHNDTMAFVKALEIAMDTNKNVFIPSGTFLVDPNVFQMVSRLGTYNDLTLRGNGKSQSILKLNNTTTDQYFSNSTSKQLYAELNFYDIAFTGNDNTANGFYCYSTGTEKRFRFYNCNFNNLSNVLYCAGTGNADMHRFYNCTAVIYGNFLTLDNAQSVNIELYGMDVNCQTGGQFIKYYKGGCVSVFGGEFETHGSTGYYLLDFSEASQSMGVGNIGLCFTGSRFEFHNQHKFLNSTSNKVINIDFTDCNLGTADSLSSGYYAELTKNSIVKLNNCSLINSLTFHVYTTGSYLSDSAHGAMLEFNNCVSNGRIYNQVTAEGNFSRVKAKGCNSIAISGTGVDDFDWNWQQRSSSAITAETNIGALKRSGEGWPKGGDEFTLTIPPNCFVKKIKIYRPALTASTASYVLHVGNSNKSVVYGETAGTSTFNDEINIDVEDIGFVADNVIKVWATGEATNITTLGYGYIEYI